ncbi:MAG: hypothetical protein KJ896_02285, partial [Nanoarchaeota archaeon]|nr:hypothetical protein [Nanoarchaeota archaeon]
SGKKVDIISVPKIFKNSSKKTKLALLQGIFMFDGGVDYCTGYVSLVSRSPNLIRDVIILLNEINLQPDYISKKMDKFQRSRLLFRKNSKLVNNINLFEKDTEKWFRLNEHFYGLSNKTKDLNKALRNLDKFYPKKRKNALTFSDVIKVVHSLQDEATYKNVVKKLGKGKTVTYTYLDKLTKWKILNSKRRGLEKIWQLNQELYFPRR